MSTVRIITMNTRLGVVDVQKMCALSQGLITSDGAPDNIYHGALIAFDTMFEFIFDAGLVTTQCADGKSCLADCGPINSDITLTTNVSKETFLKWCEDVKESNYLQSHYNVSENNCLTFVSEACKVLQIEEPAIILEEREWYIKNKVVGSVIQVMLDAALKIEQAMLLQAIPGTGATGSAMEQNQ